MVAVWNILDLVFKAFSRRFQGFCFPVSRLLARGTVAHGGGGIGDGNLTLVGIYKNAARVNRLKALASISTMGLVFG